LTNSGAERYNLPKSRDSGQVLRDNWTVYMLLTLLSVRTCATRNTRSLSALYSRTFEVVCFPERQNTLGGTAQRPQASLVSIQACCSYQNRLLHYTLPSVVKPVLRRTHTIQESNKGAVTLKNAALWPCWPQVSSEFISCRNSSHCSYWLFVKSKKCSWRLELLTTKNIADVFSYHAIYVNNKSIRFLIYQSLELWSWVGWPADMLVFLNLDYLPKSGYSHIFRRPVKFLPIIFQITVS